MHHLPAPLIWLLIALATSALVWMYRRDLGRIRRRRAAFFSASLELFQSCRVTQDGLGYPVLEGRYRGFQVKLEPVLDQIAWRKIPSLWLKATVLQANPHAGVFDLMMRPQGTEFYSPGGDLEHRVRTPATWPSEAVIRTDDPAAMPGLDLIAPHVALFAEPRMKELLVTPLGIRLVRQVWQAQRAHYAVLRQAVFDEHVLEPGLARSLLDAAIEVGRSLAAPAPLLKAS